MNPGSINIVGLIFGSLAAIWLVAIELRGRRSEGFRQFKVHSLRKWVEVCEDIVARDRAYVESTNRRLENEAVQFEVVAATSLANLEAARKELACEEAPLAAAESVMDPMLQQVLALGLLALSFALQLSAAAWNLVHAGVG